jgi:hypothetical protein
MTKRRRQEVTVEQSWSLESADTSPPERLSDEELTAMALAADPSAPLDANAVPWYGSADSRNLLPEWYMPRPIATQRGRGNRVVVISVVTTLLVICAMGLCVTSGFLTLA